ncbi:succinate-semialdehyde dehydrogenase / glutarate-semialdehyde dehydrogenase [Nocardioides alpinus]|jgi:succinate-semialdehyde dehydrogenase / glutarate-semialdehyde dehydrogenase|uniref:NAD-dependent succinate-semialdehyde dehydrogenase n=2 Tax=Nocardioides TaxID=1839 RepID=A0A4Q2SJN0_9ACTN|nr:MULTISPECIES: NAD-dependent succinate-semialdehyde dehydrogenase [Nocardioides]PKH40139.1 NAD-dependent succinate-semialdehyde dehydrogenase [Nocardioides alpinus]RYC05612.1 NAD-dependent succinate-semialdehyde dehydrogenase [Nocardioides zhouii]SFB44538.1 succinate-semialdehyde dehydrogenase / glutarate-semialdehyde dehydrogenase [Nocardioides alpinus]
MTLSDTIEALNSKTGILIAGDWKDGDRQPFEVHDPADESVLAVVADGGARRAGEAVDAAAAAAGVWASTSPRARSDALMRVFHLMLERLDELAELISAENGKAIADSRAEVAYAAEFFRWYAEEAVRPRGDFGSSPTGGVRTVVSHRPVGVAALITPWNFPAAMATRKIAPALAAGCTVVLKPASETPLTALALARLVADAGVPSGVLNIVPTTEPQEVVTTWIEDPRVRALSFTGSTGVGRALLAQAAQRVLKTSMELGGNAPFIVMADADVSAAVDGAMTAKFRGGGQACTAANRFYVHESVARHFIGMLSERIEALRVGPGSDLSSQVGPLISSKAVTGIGELVADAVRRGARVAAQADVPSHLTGHFVAPTLLVDVPFDARVVQEEIFGPVAPVVTWRDVEQLVQMVNEPDVGLASYIYSRDLKQAMQIAERIEVGMVGINRGLVSDPSAPFGGMKQSGLGREGAREGLVEYQETQYYSLDWSTP